MYGLLLENLAEYIKINYGEEKWDDIRRQAGIDAPSFSVHQVYPENLLNKLAKKAQQVSVYGCYTTHILIHGTRTSIYHDVSNLRRNFQTFLIIGYFSFALAFVRCLSYQCTECDHKNILSSSVKKWMKAEIVSGIMHRIFFKDFSNLK